MWSRTFSSSWETETGLSVQGVPRPRADGQLKEGKQAGKTGGRDRVNLRSNTHSGNFLTGQRIQMHVNSI